MSGLQRFFLLVTAFALLCSCTRTITVNVPPRIDLGGYPTIGVIAFDATQPELGSDATQNFLANLASAQPGVRLLELGSRAQVLKEVGRSELDLLAIRAIGQKYGVAALATGSVDLSAPRAGLDIGTNLSSLSAQTKIDGKMNAKLWETATGATVWTNSSWGSWKVSGVGIGSNGLISVTHKNQKEQRNSILNELVRSLNGDFWPTTTKQQVK